MAFHVMMRFALGLHVRKALTLDLQLKYSLAIEPLYRGFVLQLH